ncbi:MAG: PrsW family intramembrane metalloprotease [Burkholderiaceae bacterium]|jgi:RsiW-degrading membrane proteinase PrsW (M82 family)|nr:PrsW family intramembrane metalloprotease [Burkholderiaceae bacterium]
MPNINTLHLLEKLAELRASGAITEEEFNAEKSRLLQAPPQGRTASGQQAASPPRDSSPPGSASAPSNPLLDFITTRLGLERIEQFSLSHLFSETFTRHQPEEIENIFSVGSSMTTPALNDEMKKFPTPWVFFRVFIAGLLLFVLFSAMVYTTQNIKLLPGAMILGSFTMPLVTLLLFFELNTPRNVSIYRVFSFVLAGGTVSLLLTLILNATTDLYSILGSGAAGILEESAKLATVIFLLALLPVNYYPYRLNALLLGAAVGTGFAAFESIGYVLLYGFQEKGAINLERMMIVTITRAVFTPLCHIAWTAITSAAYWAARRKHGSAFEALTSAEFLKLFAAPVLLHFTWNSLGNVSWWWHFTLGFIAWVIIISLVQSGLKDIENQLQAADARADEEKSSTADQIERV